MPKLYNDNGYLNIDYILGSRQPFIFCVGGRGTGKTYGILKYVLDNKIPFIYMRRTQAQADIISKPEFSPFKAICNDTDYLICTKSLTKYNAGFYHGERDEEGIVKPQGAPIGYLIALSTVSNLRGFDMSEIEILIYDEFIGEAHERPLKEEANALFNCYETVNRNRELKGCKPLQMVCLANANNLQNPIFESLGLINKAVKMSQTGREVSIMSERGIALYILKGSPISQQKSQTALYEITNGTQFYNMSINNSFGIDNQNVKAVNIKEYRPVLSVCDLVIYKHKSKNQYYVSTFKSGGCKNVTDKIFRLTYGKQYKILMFNNNINFETYAIQTTFENLLN